MKRKYYIEIENSDSILGGVYPLGEMTEKQALDKCEKTVKDIWRSDKKRNYKVDAYLCLDPEGFDSVVHISLYEGNNTIYDYRTETIIKNESSERIKKICSELDEIFESNGCKEVQVAE